MSKPLLIDERRLRHLGHDLQRSLKAVVEEVNRLPADQQQAAGWEALRSIWPDHHEWIQNNLWISTKIRGQTIPLRYNLAQNRLATEMRRQQALGIPVRIIVLKARQMGVSTWTQAQLFTHCAHNPHTFGITVAHKKDGSRNLMRMSRRYMNNLLFAPPHQPPSASSIIFDHDSYLAIETARSGDDMGRSHTIHHLHCSELAFWPQPEAGLNALFQTMGEYPGCSCLIESTANGKNYFHTFWEASVNGDTDFVPIFLPWFEDPTYRRMIPDVDKKEFEASLSKEERDLRKKYDLAFEQLAWRRHTIRNKCGNSLPKFYQEYPSNAKEAFQFSSAPVFRVEDIERRKADANEGDRYDILWGA